MNCLYKLSTNSQINSPPPQKPKKSNITTTMDSPFSSSFSDGSSSSSAVAVTRDEFNAFHKIDRTLYTRLVFVLNRDIIQSYQVVAFLYLLEQIYHARDLILFLGSLPDAFVDAVANEILVCLSFLYNREYSTFFLANNADDRSVIPLIVRLTGGKLSLRFIHENRQTLLLGLRKNLTDICDRAFEDLCARAERRDQERLLALEKERVIEEMSRVTLSGRQETSNRLSVRQESFSTLLPSVKEETKNTEEAEKEKNKEVVLPADDRTVFLTFSKGYPVSEEEVRVFFTKRFGEVIEAIVMGPEEEENNGQPVFARMVLKMRYVSKLEEIVTARNKNMFTIDGKHVKARKYIPRSPTSAASSSHV